MFPEPMKTKKKNDIIIIIVAACVCKPRGWRWRGKDYSEAQGQLAWNIQYSKRNNKKFNRVERESLGINTQAEECRKKRGCVYAQRDISATKDNKTMSSLGEWRQPEIIELIKLRQVQKDKVMLSPSCTF